MTVPPAWPTRRLKFLATLNDAALTEDTDPEFELLYIDIGNVDSSGRVHDIAPYRFEAAPSRARRLVKDGDVIISTVRTYLEAIAPITAPPENLVVSTGFAVVRPKTDKLDPGFCKYALRERRFMYEVVARSTGISYPAINASELADIALPVPPINVQRRIAAFLDAETERLDALVIEKQRMLDLLSEKRRALIARSITQGRNPDAPRRDSGIPWLGEIPAHWQIERAKWLFIERDIRSDTGDEKLLSVSHLTGVTSRAEKNVNMFMAESLEGYKRCEAGDLVINTLWAWMGAMGVARQPGIVSPAYNVYQPVPEFDPEYVDLLVRTPRFAEEVSFESVIEAHLLSCDYESIAPTQYQPGHAFFPEIALAFIRTSQQKEWGKLEALHGANTEATVLKDLTHWLDTYGTLAVLRNGFKCYGRTLRVAFFKPAHGMNPELAAQYAANRVGVTRQLRYSLKNTNELDLVLSINGIPVVTAELKNPMTGQTVTNAIAQYSQDRDHREPLFEFKRRALVHFAVDTDLVFMTTRLAGGATHFLPFNKGLEGGAGNPPDPKGLAYRTAYLWEDVWQRDSLLDIFARFMHLQVEEKRTKDGRKIKKETMVFPRYHQLQAVRALEAAARAEGPGHNYLVEHSAGSGKSNTIGWLAHRLASLHDDANHKVFDSVIVITDRRVLDRQLQDTIYQFEHRQGVVLKIDEDSRQLAEALTNCVPIIISTLQKFPFVARQLAKMAEERGGQADGVLPTRRCAVIIGEAHSSQSGETATNLKEVLGGSVLREEAARYAIEEGVENLDELYRSMAKRGRQANLSFFAFTATPKHKTLAVFGRDEAGKPGQPFHRYTMRQAIEEGFIMDVLKNYTTYATYYKLVKASEDDPNVERKQAAKVLARFMRLHPYNIAQKTEVMIEHFNAVTRHRIGGKAKAMVVTGSRLEAVRYKLAFDAYIREKGYSWIKTLVAFSGEVMDEELPGQSWTEVRMNDGIKEGELPEKFDSPDYQVLLVAEKYQTGYDQPLLHTMYVDKRLAGIQAVQTLSRLNRMHPLKEDTFVLDFVNAPEEIREAFKQYFEGAEMGEEAEPNRMYAIKAELDASGIYLPEEVQRFIEVYFKPKQRQSAADHQVMNATLDPAVDRFAALQVEDEEQAELWRGKLNAFRNLYSFLSQVIPYQDSELERLYTFLRLLSPELPKRIAGQRYSFDDEIRLEYYRLQKISEGSISLREGKAEPLDGPREVGSGAGHDEDVPLSRLIDVINERFGTDFTDADQLFFDQIIEAAMEDGSLREAAAVNPEEKFALLFSGLLETLFIERMEQNEDIFARFMNERDFQNLVSHWVSRQVYGRLRSAAKSDSSRPAGGTRIQGL